MAAVLAGDRGRLIEHGVSLCWEVRPVCYYTDVSAVSGVPCSFVVGRGLSWMTGGWFGASRF